MFGFFFSPNETNSDAITPGDGGLGRSRLISTTSKVSAEVVMDGAMVYNLDCESSSTGVFIWCLNTAHDGTPVIIYVWLLAISYVGCSAGLA